MLVYRADCQQRRDCHTFGVHAAIGDDEQVVAEPQCVFRMCTERCHGRFNALGSPCGRIGNVEFFTAKIIAGKHVDMANFFHIVGGQYWLRDFQPLARIGVVDIEQIRARADRDCRGHHQFFTDRIDRRIGHLCK